RSLVRCSGIANHWRGRFDLLDAEEVAIPFRRQRARLFSSGFSSSRRTTFSHIGDRTARFHSFGVCQPDIIRGVGVDDGRADATVVGALSAATVDILIADFMFWFWNGASLTTAERISHPTNAEGNSESSSRR